MYNGDPILEIDSLAKQVPEQREISLGVAGDQEVLPDVLVPILAQVTGNAGIR